MIAEKIQLLGKGLYKDIPDELTLKSIPTVSELDYVGSEDFEATMLDKILPSAVEEKINFHQLLEIDFTWVCRCLRFLNYGPYFTTPSLFCKKCGQVGANGVMVDLRTIGCKTLPEGFTNDVVIKKDEFLDFDKDVHLKLLTIQERINAFKDPLFMKDGKLNREFARLCYSISSIGSEHDVTPINAKVAIEQKFSRPDYLILLETSKELTDYGLRAGGSATCPVCGSEAAYIALVDDRFLRPSVGDIKAGRNDRHARYEEVASGSSSATV